MFCPTCGNSIPNDAAFCPRCGCACSTGVGTFPKKAPREPFSIGSSWRAFKSFWTFQDWNRRATRTEYWSFFLWKFLLQISFFSTCAAVVWFVLTVFAVASSNRSTTITVAPDESSSFIEADEAEFQFSQNGGKFETAVENAVSASLFGIISILAAANGLGFLLFIVPTLCATVRRLHDVDASGAFAILQFIPNVSTIATIVIGFLDPTASDNRFGPNPRLVPQFESPQSAPAQDPTQVPTPESENQRAASAEPTNAPPAE